MRETEHFFLDLAQFNEPLKEWVADKTYWRPNVRNFTLNLLQEGLRGRAITRDIDWGIPVPVEGYADKRIYVWFDAVIGYLLGQHRVGAQSRHARGLARVVGPRQAVARLLLYRQGQHLFPHPDLAGDADGLWRPRTCPTMCPPTST